MDSLPMMEEEEEKIDYDSLNKKYSTAAVIDNE